jgi:predicted nucleotidyltransferase
MNRAEVIARLKIAEPALRERGVAALYLYGSYARDEAREDSDIDVLVELDESTDPGLVGYMAPYIYLEEAFPEAEIGYSTQEGLEPLYRPVIEQSAIRIF